MAKKNVYEQVTYNHIPGVTADELLSDRTKQIPSQNASASPTERFQNTFQDSIPQAQVSDPLGCQASDQARQATRDGPVPVGAPIAKCIRCKAANQPCQ